MPTYWATVKIPTFCFSSSRNPNPLGQKLQPLNGIPSQELIDFFKKKADFHGIAQHTLDMKRLSKALRWRSKTLSEKELNELIEKSHQTLEPGYVAPKKGPRLDLRRFLVSHNSLAIEASRREAASYQKIISKPFQPFDPTQDPWD